MPREKPQGQSPWSQLGAAVSDFVNHPDYYKGRWAIYFRRGRRICTNHTTADAWCKYLRRNFSDGWTATIGRVDPLPGFPRTIH